MVPGIWSILDKGQQGGEGEEKKEKGLPEKQHLGN